MTVAPRSFAHWQAMRPTPPAAAWNRMVSPDCTGYARRNRYSTVMPCNIIAAACRESIPAGIFTTFPAGIRRSSA